MSIVAQFAGRLTCYGLIISPLATLISWQIIFPFNFSVFIIMAMIYLIPLGVLVGFVCGLISGIITFMFFHEVYSHLTYLLIIITLTSGFAFVMTSILVGMLHSVMAVVEVPFFSEISLLGGLLAAIGAGYAVYRVGNWYLQQQKSS